SVLLLLGLSVVVTADGSRAGSDAGANRRALPRVAPDRAADRPDRCASCGTTHHFTPPLRCAALGRGARIESGLLLRPLIAFVLVAVLLFLALPFRRVDVGLCARQRSDAAHTRGQNPDQQMRSHGFPPRSTT